MSEANVDAFYEVLEVDRELRAKTLSLKDKYPDQDDLVDAFIRFAAENGFEFTFEEYMQVMYRRACQQPD